MMGRAFHYALAALGPQGIDHLIDIFIKDMDANMGQMGAKSLGALPAPVDLDQRFVFPNGLKSPAEA